jgi:hypothetical protein
LFVLGPLFLPGVRGVPRQCSLTVRSPLDVERYVIVAAGRRLVEHDHALGRHLNSHLDEGFVDFLRLRMILVAILRRCHASTLPGRGLACVVASLPFVIHGPDDIVEASLSKVLLGDIPGWMIGGQVLELAARLRHGRDTGGQGQEKTGYQDSAHAIASSGRWFFDPLTNAEFTRCVAVGVERQVNISISYIDSQPFG